MRKAVLGVNVLSTESPAHPSSLTWFGVLLVCQAGGAFLLPHPQNILTSVLTVGKSSVQQDVIFGVSVLQQDLLEGLSRWHWKISQALRFPFLCLFFPSRGMGDALHFKCSAQGIPAKGQSAFQHPDILLLGDYTGIHQRWALSWPLSCQHLLHFFNDRD